MGHIHRWTFRLLMASMFLMGCSTIQKEVIPVHDETLTYEVPYDLAYLRTFEALESLPGWDIEQTVKDQGIITVRNINFGQFNDADKRLIKVWIDRKDRFRTEIQLAPESQRVIGGGEVLNYISQYVSREL